VRTAFHVIAVIIGAIALAFLVDHLGWDGMEHVVTGTGGWFAVIAAIDLASVCCDAFAIHGFLDRKVAYWKVFGAQASGIAINRLTPGNALGEPVKVTMLVRDVAATDATAAIVMFNLMTMYVGIAAIAIGVPLTAVMLDLPHTAAVIAWGGLAALVVLGIVVAVLVRRGALATLISALAGIHAISHERAERWRAKVVSIDVHLRHLADTSSPGIRRGIAGVLGSRVCNWAGTIVVLHAIGVNMTAPLIVAMLSVGILITWISNVLPLGLGIADGTNYALYAVLGASPDAGLVFTMVNRVRTVVLATMGLAIMAIANALDRSSTARSRYR
jgi:uncharacterized protein (TIRG00374 family)